MLKHGRVYEKLFKYTRYEECLQFKSIVLTKHIKENPVTNIALFDNGVDYFPSNESESYIKKIRPHFWTYYDNKAVDDDEEAEHCE